MWNNFFAFVFCAASVQTLYADAVVTLAARENCGPNDPVPVTRVNTTERLRKFRDALKTIRVNNSNVAAFIVGTGDAHNSEYPTEHDQRRAYISGFQGSAGTAVITETKAALWTDGRYFIEAEKTLDCNWLLMKSGLADTPTYEQWLNDEIAISGAYVGVDRTLITHTSFKSLKDNLQQLSRKLEPQAIRQNPVDVAWAAQQPPQPVSPINVLDLAFAGISWQDKVKSLRDAMQKKGASAFIVTALDEIAWLFNLRGSDISYNPFFLSYAIVEDTRVRLYILEKDRRLQAQPTDPETNVTLAVHLGTSNKGSCEGRIEPCVEVLDYDQTEIESALLNISSTGKVWITYDANYAVFQSTEKNHTIGKSPIALQKSQKNEVERKGMKNAYNRDSAALIKFLAFLENEIKSGKQWTEISAANELDNRRKQLKYNRGLSFTTISGFGSNGAIIHYSPRNETNKNINTDSLYLLDSGGQYLDGTTDVTRTMHYGNPTDYQKECYTRVLMAFINLAILQWPKGLYGSQIDAITRAALWEVGLVYRHGTGHGIGAYLSVHEGPGGIGMRPNIDSSVERIYPYQYYSDEPGYYEDGQFGIRLETILMVNNSSPKYTTANEQFYKFVPVTFVPFEANLIDYSLLNKNQIEYLNDYNEQAKLEVLPLLEDDQTAKQWFNSRTQTISIFNIASQTSVYWTCYVTIFTALFTMVV